MNVSPLPSWPQDLHAEWVNVLRRLQSVGHTQQGVTIVTIHVILDANGKPVSWASPTFTSLEPRRNSEEFLSLLANYLNG